MISLQPFIDIRSSGSQTTLAHIEKAKFLLEAISVFFSFFLESSNYRENCSMGLLKWLELEKGSN